MRGNRKRNALLHMNVKTQSTRVRKTNYSRIHIILYIDKQHTFDLFNAHWTDSETVFECTIWTRDTYRITIPAALAPLTVKICVVEDNAL